MSRESMVHRKERHSSSLKTCTFFMEGNCAFDTECGICGVKITRKKDFMEHRKEVHYEYISECIENKNGACRFDSDCWYRHTVVVTKDETVKEVNGMKTPELIERLFKMMEAFADRMVQIENKI
jgi:hypothetical protein